MDFREQIVTFALAEGKLDTDGILQWIIKHQKERVAKVFSEEEGSHKNGLPFSDVCL